MRLLAFANWSLFAIGALLALLYAVVCLMMWPYPELVAEAGGDFGQILRLTLALTAFSAVAGVATWLLQKRHRRWWLGQCALFAALIVLVVFAVFNRA